MDMRLFRHMRPVLARFRSVRVWTWLGLVWLSVAAAGSAWYWLQLSGTWYVPGAAWMLGILGIAAAASIAVIAWSSSRDPSWVA